MRSFPALLLCTALLQAQASNDALSVVNQIKGEAFDRSQVMDTLSNLTDAHGPRLTASPEFDDAAKWAMDRLKGYGLSNVHEEAWGPFGRSWSIEGYNLEMTTPRYSHLDAAPLAWSAPTKGDVNAGVMATPMPPREYDPKKYAAQIEDFKKKWAGKLRGKAVLLSDDPASEPRNEANFSRYTEAELSNLEKAPDPVAFKKLNWDDLQIPGDPAARRKFFQAAPDDFVEELFDRLQTEGKKLTAFLLKEGVAVVLTADRRAHDALDFAEAAGSEKAADPLSPTTFIVTEEQYSRMLRLVQKNIPVTVRANLRVKTSDKDEMGQNIIGEIPGTEKNDEVVMVGAHFDSWHTGTGATDNGAGSAVMIEVMRVLKAIKLPMKRTVRIGLWSGEEQGLYGSKAYVKQHFGDPKAAQKNAEHQKFDVYLNLDNGSGKIRGVYLQGNDAARPEFEHLLRPFRDMGAGAISIRNTGGTDHLSFDAVGLPGFQFIQDPLDYGTVTHHSSMDTYSHAIPEDLMQASAIISTLVYQLANADKPFPRKAAPLSAAQ